MLPCLEGFLYHSNHALLRDTFWYNLALSVIVLTAEFVVFLVTFTENFGFLTDFRNPFTLKFSIFTAVLVTFLVTFTANFAHLQQVFTGKFVFFTAVFHMFFSICFFGLLSTYNIAWIRGNYEEAGGTTKSQG